jgi:hypothetical protein
VNIGEESVKGARVVHYVYANQLKSSIRSK